MPTVESNQVALFSRFGVALIIGILVGLQREHSHGGPDKQLFAGVRTFALMSLIGCATALIAQQLATPLIFVGVLGVLGALWIAAYLTSAQGDDVGLTTEMAALLTVFCGALCYWGYLLLAAALGVVTTGLLALKVEMHTFARRITRDDLYATLTFAMISVVILPLLPDQTFGPPPFDVLNPYHIWLMVVFISGISFLGYVLFKVVGARRGIALTGLLGGLVSSTAVTLSFTQRSREEPGLAKPFALAITVAWTVMFIRVLVVVAALNDRLLAVVWLPLAAAALAGFACFAYLFVARSAAAERTLVLANPFQLWPAITFSLVYAGILLVANVARLWLGNTGVYLSSLVAGFADVDAITLSLAELSGTAGGIDLTTAARAVMLAALANTAIKGSIVLVRGSSGLRRAIAPILTLMILVGGGIALLI